MTLQAQIAQSFPNILRTVHLPNDKVGQIRTEIENLSMQIQQQRQEHESEIMKLRDEKAAFEEMQRERYIANQSKLD